MHSNFSTKYMRETGGKEYFEKLMAAFNQYRDEHIAVYGPENHLRLTGLHETQSIDKFSYGVADRGASVRVPHSFINAGYKGYLEDRRPNSAADPYLVAGRILKTIQTVPLPAARPRKVPGGFFCAVLSLKVEPGLRTGFQEHTQASKATLHRACTDSSGPDSAGDKLPSPLAHPGGVSDGRNNFPASECPGAWLDILSKRR
jgi:hypothetical protein